MLFSVKNHLLPTLLLWVAFTAGALLARAILGLEWVMVPGREAAGQVLFWLLVVASSDALLHLLLWGIGWAGYLARYRALVFHFQPQGVPEILASGLLAASEEWVFRGVLLAWLLQGLGWPAPAGIAVAALAFGLSHVIRERQLAPFAIWAVWEGILLGTVYVQSGSLLVVMVVHGLHDTLGYLLFAFQRRTGWLV